MWEGILVAIAISMDSLSAGIAYGIKKIKVPLLSLIILDFISVLLLSLGFFSGNLLALFIPEIFAKVLGCITLIFLGLWMLIQGWLNYKYPKEKIEKPISIINFSIKSMGIAVSIIRNPSKADMDISGIIDTKEAILLGIALAIDSLAIGLAISFFPVSVIVVTLFLVAASNLLFMLTGIKIGKKFLSCRLKNAASFLPGLILITLGFIRII